MLLFFIKGLFNIGNRLLVSIDLFLKIRASIKLGQNPSEVVRVMFDHSPNHPGEQTHTNTQDKHTLGMQAVPGKIASGYLNICSFPLLSFGSTSSSSVSSFYWTSPQFGSRGVVTDPGAPPERLLGL